jgi:hypothetical protein
VFIEMQDLIRFKAPMAEECFQFDPQNLTIVCQARQTPQAPPHSHLNLGGGGASGSKGQECKVGGEVLNERGTLYFGL